MATKIERIVKQIKTTFYCLFSLPRSPRSPNNAVNCIIMYLGYLEFLGIRIWSEIFKMILIILSFILNVSYRDCVDLVYTEEYNRIERKMSRCIDRLYYFLTDIL